MKQMSKDLESSGPQLADTERCVREFATVSPTAPWLQPPFPALQLALQRLSLRPLSGTKLMTLPDLQYSLLVALNSHSIWLSLGPHTETKELLRPSMERIPVIPRLKGHKQDQCSVPARATCDTVTLNKAGVVDQRQCSCLEYTRSSLPSPAPF